jgi:hypothetical protein
MKLEFKEVIVQTVRLDERERKKIEKEREERLR